MGLRAEVFCPPNAYEVFHMSAGRAAWYRHNQRGTLVQAVRVNLDTIFFSETGIPHTLSAGGAIVVESPNKACAMQPELFAAFYSRALCDGTLVCALDIEEANQLVAMKVASDEMRKRSRRITRLVKLGSLEDFAAGAPLAGEVRESAVVLRKLSEDLNAHARDISFLRSAAGG
jgi:hypothetical protein